MFKIDIEILLDACGIVYTDKQLENLKELVNSCIQQHIDKYLKLLEQNPSTNDVENYDEISTNSSINQLYRRLIL